MTPQAFRFALQIVGWSPTSLARHLQCDESLCRRWASGNNAVPPKVAEWLRLVVQAHLAMPPPPDDWRVR